MSLNWKEMELILKEADLNGSRIQSVTQNQFHSVIWELYSPQRGRFLFYSEVGTPSSRINLTTKNYKESKKLKLQRFAQYARANIEGSIIVSASMVGSDRLAVWELNNHGRLLKIFFRLYSGSGANIVVTDENMVIQDMLFRRPTRGETSGCILNLEPQKNNDTDKFSLRPWTEGTFNNFIDNSYSEASHENEYSELLKAANISFEREKNALEASIRGAKKRCQDRSFEELKKDADLLSSSVHLVKSKDKSIEVTDWNTGNKVLVMLDPSLSGGENLKAYYDRYQKAKGTWENACSELEKLTAKLESVTRKYNFALQDSGNLEENLRKLRLLKGETAHKNDKPTPVVGVRCESGGFQILAGRNAKENDELLRKHAKGNDMWLHTRDLPGGYVFIKYRRDKSVPLEVLLDAANIAILFSKARNSEQIDLYYTQVKYLRRAKDGKTGLVLPTQEKNLSVKFDKQRAQKLLASTEEHNA